MDVTGHRTDRHPWRAAVVVGLALAALGMLYATVVAPGWLGLRQWQIAVDVWVPMQPAAYVANGAFPYLYEVNRFFVAMPLLPVVLAPVAAVGQHLNLTESVPVPLPRPTLWWVLGPYGMASGIAVLYGARRLAVALGVRRRLLVLQTGVAAVGLVTLDLLWGHYEDVLALAFLLVGAALAIRGRFVRAALLLGVAIGFKQWAVLALPCFIGFAPAGTRLRATLAAVAVPGFLGAIVLAADWPAASKALFDAQVFPAAGGHLALWVGAHARAVSGTPGRALAVAAAALLGWRLRNRADPGRFVGSLALALLTRLLFEPLVLAYYLCPGLVVLIVAELYRTGRMWRSTLLGLLALWLFPLHPAPALWWAAELLVCSAAAWPALREVFGRPAPAGLPASASAPRTASTAGPAARATAPTARR